MDIKERKNRDELREFLKKSFPVGTVQEACFQLDINEGLMSKILTGYRDPTPDIVKKLETVPGFKQSMI